MSYLRIGQDELTIWDVRTHDWEEISAETHGYGDGDKWYRFPGTWTMFVDRIRTELPDLVDLQFAFDENGYRCQLAPDSFPTQRYNHFHIGKLPL